MELTEEQTTTLQALFIATDNLTGYWPAIKSALEEFGIEDAEAAFENLRDAAFNN